MAESRTLRTFRRIERAALDEKGRTVDVAFSSETPIQDHPFGQPVVLLHEPGSVDFSRASSALLNHDPARILGRLEDVRIDPDRRGRARMVFDDDEDGAHAMRKVRSGSLAGVSVSYVAREFQVLGEDDVWTSPAGREFRGPLEIATKWAPVEVSLTPIPADSTVGVGRSNQQRTETEMTETTTDPATAERQRCRELAQVAEQAGLQDRLATWIERGVTADAARTEGLEHVRATHRPIGESRHSDAQVTRDAHDKFRDTHAAGILRRVGLLRDQHAECEELTLAELAKRCLARTGEPVTGPTGDVVRRALAHTTSHFPDILENSLRKAVAVSYEEAGSTWQTWARLGNAQDFKTMSRVALGSAPALLETPEAMPVQEGSYSDQKESFAISTYARRFSITRQAIINDDLSLFSDIAMGFGAAARRAPNKVLYDLLLSNSGSGPAMRDANNVFDSTNHANVGTAGALSKTTLGELRKLVRTQTGPVASGETAPTLNLNPRILLVPAALETTAEELLATLANPAAKDGDFNPNLAGQMQLVVEARLDATSGTAFYVVTAPSAFPVAEVAFLNGSQAPTIARTEHTEVILGVSWVAYIDVGAAFLDWRGLARNAGA